MVVSDGTNALRARLLAARLRQAALETEWPGYRAKLLQAAQDLEEEAAKLEGQHSLAPPGASQAG
jgi:hypothetical protein